MATIVLPASREANWDVKLNLALSQLATSVDSINSQLTTISNTLGAVQATLTALQGSVGAGVVWQA